MRTTKKSAAFAALLVAGLMLVGAACGGSSSKSSDSSSGSSSATSKSSDGNASGCAELFNKTEELSASMDAMDVDSSTDMGALVKALESFSSNVPSEIRDDWKTIVSAIKEYAEAIEDIDMSDITDLNNPKAIEMLEKAGAAMQSPEYMEASENLDQWTQKNCPGFDF